MSYLVSKHFACMLSCSRRVWLCAALWTVAHQAPLSIGFSRQEHWRGLLCPPPGELPNLGIKLVSLMSPALAGGFFITSATWEAQWGSQSSWNTLFLYLSYYPFHLQVSFSLLLTTLLTYEPGNGVLVPDLVQFSSSVQSLSRVRLCDPMDRSTPGLPVHHQLLEFTQTHVHWAGDAIQPSHALPSLSPSAFKLSHLQGLF